MAFPESQRIVFRENPLVEVICQLRFPPILAIASELPAAFQEKVRDVYPAYHRDEGFAQLPPEVSSVLADLPIPLPADSVSHRFETEDGKRLVSLTRDFVAVTDRDYLKWEQFAAEMKRAKAALEEVYRPAFYSRVGLRYIDQVDRAALGIADVDWPDLIAGPLLGLLGADDEIRRGVTAARGEALIALDEPPGAFVRVRYGLAEEANKNSYTVDADFFTAERSETDAVFDVLDDFNRQAGHLWRWAIQPGLRDALGRRED